MNTEYLLALLGGILLIVYLLYAMLYPEKF